VLASDGDFTAVPEPPTTDPVAGSGAIATARPTRRGTRPPRRGVHITMTMICPKKSFMDGLFG
jgi:hypothetical protein